MAEEGGADMGRISKWFTQHPKTRIALQLVLDGLPFLMVVIWSVMAIAEIEDLFTVPQWLGDLLMTYMVFGMYGGNAVLFVLGIWLRSRAVVAFECYPWCKIVSFVLRILSFIPAVISFGFLIGIVVHYF